MKASSDIVVNVNNGALSITQSRKAYIKNVLYFCFLSLFLFSGLYFFYYFLKDRISVWAFVFVALVVEFIYFIFNKKRLKFKTIKLSLNNKLVTINDHESLDVSCRKKVILYEFTGDVFVKAEGNLFLSLNDREFPLAYTANSATIDQIRGALDAFFGEQIIFEKGKIYL